MFLRYALLVLGVCLSYVKADGNDTLGWEDGYIVLETANFHLELVKDSQTLASLRPAGNAFDFVPFDYIEYRAADGMYHTGDITYRYRTTGESNWTQGDSAAARQKVTTLSSDGLAAADLSATLPAGVLNVTREWKDIDGDLGLIFNLTNTGSTSLEIGSLGFPMEFNSIFTNRTADEIQEVCSLHDPYIGLDAGYIRVTPISGVGAAVVVTPLENTPFQAWRDLVEPVTDATDYGSQTFEGYYEWQTLSTAYAENEWSAVEPWNNATSQILAADETATFGLRFSVALDGVRGIEEAVKNTGTPFAVGVPGYVVPADLTARLYLFANSNVLTVISEPQDAFTIIIESTKVYTLTPKDSAWGRVRVTVTYTDGKVQTVHYYITKSGTSALADLGTFTTTSSWFMDESDPFGRSPSPISYDRSVNAQVLQEPRVWIAGLSDEAGAGTYIAATMKQAAQPNADEVAKLEVFIDQVLFGTIQTLDYAVRKSAFYYDPAVLSSYPYNSSFDWTSWTSWNLTESYATDRGYDYVHTITAYWSLYRVGRAYPDLVSVHTWDWYLTQAYKTVMSLMRTDGNGTEIVGYVLDGLMEETVIGELLKDLRREEYTLEANNVEANMSARAAYWDTESVPFGSEMAWDSTGQEGIYYWSKYFGYTATMDKTVNSILGYNPTVAHWGWNGNARRYWDNLYGGKLERIERQIHHYGSGLNALPLLSQFRSNPTDNYIIRVGYGGMNGPLTNIDQGGFAAASFHSFPDTLAWDAYSGDYGPNHVGLILGSATYVVQDPELGLVAYGGGLSATRHNGTVTVQPRDAVRHRAYIGPLGLFIEIDAGVIEEFQYSTSSGNSSGIVTVTLSQLPGAPRATAAVLWLETMAGNINYTVTTKGLTKERLGWSVPLNSTAVTVTIGPS